MRLRPRHSNNPRALSFGVATIAAATILMALTGCVPNAPTTGAISVVSTDTDCEVATNTAPSGAITFTVKNASSKTSEFYILANDGLRVVGEVENISPGLTRKLVLQAEPGSYYTVCKPGMTGSGIGNAIFTVTDSGLQPSLSADEKILIEQAASNYASYVTNQVDALVIGTEKFAAAYTAGDDQQARALYAPTRTYWERIETVAESFGDLDPILDAREADLSPGQEWTGWHAIEKDLWPADAEDGFAAYSQSKRSQLASGLVTHTRELKSRVANMTFSLSQLSNGAIGLLDEVATGKVTGEEEIWSHTDLWDFQANVDGARVLYEGLRPILLVKNKPLATAIDTELSKLQDLLNSHKQGAGFVYYDQLSTSQVRALSDQVNALAERLNELTAALVS